MRETLRMAGLLVPLVGLLIGCSSGISINTDYDQQFDFATLKTYAIHPQITAKTLNLVQQRVVTAIDADLSKKGFTKVDPSAADFLVAFQTSAQDKVDVSSWGYGGWYGYGGVSAYSYTEGQLTIDMVDRDNAQMIYRGSGTAIAGDKAPDQEQVSFAVSKLLKDFPPQ
jgi:hypothetical protein